MQRSTRRIIGGSVLLGIGFALYAVVAPIYRAVKNSAKYSLCMDNMKYLGVAMAQYSNDHHAYPPVFATADGQQVGWAGALLPYLGADDRFQCGYDKSAYSANPGEAGFTDYAYNANFMRRSARGVTTTGKKFKFDWPLQSVLIFDGGSLKGGPGHDGSFNQCGDGIMLAASDQSCPASNEGAAQLDNGQTHGLSTNVVFVDGHVRGVPTHQIFNNGGRQPTSSNYYTFALSGK